MRPVLYRTLALFATTSLLIGCGSADQADTTVDRYQINHICGDSPNCVSTQDEREAHYLSPFVLTAKGTKSWKQIQRLALTLPGAALADERPDYFRVVCTSMFFRFKDDFEVMQVGDTLVVRSASRVGYSDFGVNRERAEQFRQHLLTAGYVHSE